MNVKSDINPASRTFHVSGDGNDNESGLSLETANLTWATAIAAVAALPVLPGFNFSSIIGTGTAIFTEPDLVFPDACQVNAENTIFSPLTGNGVSPANISSMRIGAVTTIEAGKACFILNNSTSIGISGLSGRTFGANSYVIKVDGSCSELFFRLNQVRVGGVGSVGLLNGCDGVDPLITSVRQIILQDNDTSGIKHDHASLNTMVTSYDGVAVVEQEGSSLTGTIAFDILRGVCNAIVPTVKVETAIHVASGAVLNIACASMTGKITVDAGGTLNCHIVEHVSGTITNNGIINGVIDKENFGDMDFSGDVDIKGQLGVGPNLPATLDGTVHIQSGSSGAIGSTSAADDLTVENSSDGGISVLVPDANLAAFNMGSPGRQVGAAIRWDFTANLFSIITGNVGADISIRPDINTEAMILKSAGNIGVGTSTPDASALFDLTSTTRGLLPPRMTTAQRDAISTPATGLVIFNTDLNLLEIFNGTLWETTSDFVRSTITTTDGTLTTLATIPLPESSASLIVAQVVGRRTNGADRAAYIRRVLAFRTGAGGAQFEGMVDEPFSRDSTNAYDEDLITSGNNVLAQVKGAGGHTVDWVSRYTIERVL